MSNVCFGKWNHFLKRCTAWFNKNMTNVCLILWYLYQKGELTDLKYSELINNIICSKRHTFIYCELNDYNDQCWISIQQSVGHKKYVKLVFFLKSRCSLNCMAFILLYQSLLFYSAAITKQDSYNSCMILPWSCPIQPLFLPATKCPWVWTTTRTVSNGCTIVQGQVQ